MNSTALIRTLIVDDEPPARANLRSLLRRLSQDRVECLVHAVDASVLEGTVDRVGQDFFELSVGRDAVHVVPVSSVAALQGRP